ncbi:glycoside hydrolase family 88 protein [Spirosoma utsteinense]|uniref:Unsaturated rhamnogalacturonyl hydrolase n=1 Tax=Spirosoma utsteinense TaxID=2585773 RepID=A0ABR6W4D5_9BACT|nr:unsaturated rhamnogalacturonyl hydrolase [Spirosoma utsteinense]MBC3791459.1 unsaturated rhamnogalacturonyl hydrolase [Spirosoma utsteinense]
MAVPQPIRILYLLTFLLACFTQPGYSQNKPYSVQMADRLMALHPDSIVTKEGQPARWDYEQGLVLKALERVWDRTADARYYEYILRDINRYVGADGRIRTFRVDEYNLDNMPGGRVLLTLAQQTEANREKYRKAADVLRAQLAEQPRTKEKGFWHKQRYPNQMWLDGLFMAAPFYAEYGTLYGQPENLNDIALQFALIEKHLVDAKTGLLYHGYDESRAQKWADPTTGRSPNFWGRSIGWYAMALVDVLDYLPADHPKRAAFVGYLQRLMPAVVRYQDKTSGCWYQIVDQGSRKGNYLEASASCMFVYALAKGVRLGYLPETMQANAKRGYDGILKTFVETTPEGTLNLNGTVSVGGLGGTPYRDGSYAYYLSEPIRKNDLKGVGPFIMASVEMEMAGERKLGRGKTVGLDYYFNHEFRKDDSGGPENGKPVRFHYTWEDRMHSGFWLWGNTMRELGAKTVAVPGAPTAQSLKNVDVYIIVDPDTKKETANPNYIRKPDIDAIESWVKAGGVLVLMANDTTNCEIPHFNELAGRFGMKFQDELVNRVIGTQWEGGKLTIPTGNPIFTTTQTIYIKELAPLALTPPAQPMLTSGKHVIMATARVGKGTVFAVGDPWLYNEYTDGRRIPALYQNFQAGKELVMWLLKQ